jgi:hypothetical protein
MSVVPHCPPAPVGQQGPPTRAAAFDSWRSLRAARGPLLLTTGTGYPHWQQAGKIRHAWKI